MTLTGVSADAMRGAVVSEARESITRDELADYFRRHDSSSLAAESSVAMAASIFANVAANREPEYEPGEIYEDASGHRYLRKPYATDLPWLLIGGAGLVVERVEGVPVRPLRKLVPEGSQSAEVWWSSVLAALIAAEKHGEDMGQTAHRICKLLEGGSDD